jgi:hypothetical protein
MRTTQVRTAREMSRNGGTQLHSGHDLIGRHVFGATRRTSLFIEQRRSNAYRCAPISIGLRHCVDLTFVTKRSGATRHVGRFDQQFRANTTGQLRRRFDV